MKTFTLEEAKQNLNKVLEHADEGGTVILIGEDDKAYELVSTHLYQARDRANLAVPKAKLQSPMNSTSHCPSSNPTWNELPAGYVFIPLVRL